MKTEEVAIYPKKYPSLVFFSAKIILYLQIKGDVHVLFDRVKENRLDTCVN